MGRDELERGPLPRTVDDPCINCGENDYLSLVAVAADGGITAIQPGEVVSVLSEIDSPYEVMLVLDGRRRYAMTTTAGER